MNLHPQSGTRYLLELVSTDATDSARYRGFVYTQDEAIEYAVAIASDGHVALEATSAPAAVEHEERLASFAKVLGRSAGKKADDGFAPWPSRLLRWRK